MLCTWPELIGKQQTGTVEFISQGGLWTLLAGTKEVASGTCTAGWNVVNFWSENLPDQDEDSSNQLVLSVGDLSFDAGAVTVVEDDLEAENPKDFVKDFDDDLIYVKYISKTGGEIRAEGRTLIIDDGSAKDKLMVTVKAAKGEGDGVCRISGIICNGDLGMVKVMGTVDKLIVNGSLSKLMLKGGSLGHNCKTKLHNVRFESAAGKSKITLVAGKNKTNKKIIPANVFANILCGELKDDNSIDPQILKMIAIKGGNLGIENVKRRIDAEAVSTILVKAKGDGGDILDYSFYLTGEEKPGKKMSFKKLLANNIIDSSTSNSYFICGYDINANYNPYDVSGTNWLSHQVESGFGKIIIKGGDINGTYVIDDWAPNKGLAKQVKTKMADTDDATWIVDQEIDD